MLYLHLTPVAVQPCAAWCKWVGRCTDGSAAQDVRSRQIYPEELTHAKEDDSKHVQIVIHERGRAIDEPVHAAAVGSGVLANSIWIQAIRTKSQSVYFTPAAHPAKLQKSTASRKEAGSGKYLAGDHDAATPIVAGCGSHVS